MLCLKYQYLKIQTIKVPTSGDNWNTEFLHKKWHLKSTHVLQYDHRKSMNEWKSSKNFTWGHIFLDWEEGRRATRSRCWHSPGWSRDLWAVGRDHDRSPPWPSSPPDHRKKDQRHRFKKWQSNENIGHFLSTGYPTPVRLIISSPKNDFNNLFTWYRKD